MESKLSAKLNLLAYSIPSHELLTSMSGESHGRILKACYGFLLPLVRTLLGAGISYREFDELVRFAFVRVPSNEYGLRGRPTNSSRISAMTGIPRKEVRRIRSESANVEPFSRSELSPLGDVLHRWHTDPNFLDPDGIPKKLPLTGPIGSFEELVRCSVGDLPSGAIRVELQRIGALSQDSDGNVRVLRREAVPEEVDERLVTSFSFNLTSLASTIAFNTDPHRKGETRIERFVESDDLGEAGKRRLRHVTQRRIKLFSEEIDDMFSTVEPSNDRSSGRIGVGVYYFEED